MATRNYARKTKWIKSNNDDDDNDHDQEPCDDDDDPLESLLKEMEKVEWESR